MLFVLFMPFVVHAERDSLPPCSSARSFGFPFIPSFSYSDGMHKELKDYKNLIDKCVLCGGCHPDCPTYQLSRMEHDAARGKVLLAKALLDGDLEPTASLAETFGHCLTCMACVEACPAGADPVKVITAARDEIGKKRGVGFIPRFIFSKILPNRALMPLLAWAMGIATTLFKLLPPVFPGIQAMTHGGKKRLMPTFHFGSLKGALPEVITAQGEKTMRVAFFTGCMTDWVFSEGGMAVIDILTLCGAEVVLVKDEVCCGAPAFFAGDRASAELMAMKNLAHFAKADADYIVTSCATCGDVLKEVYPDLIPGAATRTFAGRVIDFQKLLAGPLLSRLPVTPHAGPKLKVTYHDPCHLSRGMKVVKEPREILRRLPGVEFIEMAEADRCCGGAGTFSAKYYGDAVKVGRRKAENIKASGARIVATECPSCEMQLRDMVSRFAPGVEVLSTAEVVRRALERK